MHVSTPVPSVGVTLGALGLVEVSEPSNADAPPAPPVPSVGGTLGALGLVEVSEPSNAGQQPPAPPRPSVGVTLGALGLVEVSEPSNADRQHPLCHRRRDIGGVRTGGGGATSNADAPPAPLCHRLA